MPPFMMYPRFLLKYKLSGTALNAYILLLDRARLSMSKDDWADENGEVFVIYTVHELAQRLSRSSRSITTALNDLEACGLIRRKHQHIKQPNLIYVKFPDDTVLDSENNPQIRAEESFTSDAKETSPPNGRKLPPMGEESFRLEVKKTSPPDGRNLPTSNNYGERTTKSNEMSNIGRSAYGEYANIFLTKAEYAGLKNTFPNLPRMISRMSQYLKSTGKTYQDYEAALRSWAAREPDAYIMINYECGEDESF